MIDIFRLRQLALFNTVYFASGGSAGNPVVGFSSRLPTHESNVSLGRPGVGSDNRVEIPSGGVL